MGYSWLVNEWMDGWIGRYIKVRGDPTPQVDLEGGWGYVCVVSIVFLEWWGGGIGMSFLDMKEYIDERQVGAMTRMNQSILRVAELGKHISIYLAR